MINVVLILDETGSMTVRQKETVEQFEDYIKKLKKHKKVKDIRFTLTRFNSQKLDIYYDKVKLNKVKALDDYIPDHFTPLYDAIGKTINSIDSNKCIMAVLTDGLENASTEFTLKDIIKLIEDKKEIGWEFVFLAVGLDEMQAERIFNTPVAASMNMGIKGTTISGLTQSYYVETLSYIDKNSSSG